MKRTALALTLTLLSGCGSTVAVSGRTVGTGQTGLAAPGTSSAQEGGSTLPASGRGSPPVATGGGAPASTPGAPTPAQTLPGTASTGGATGLPAAVRGMTARTITVGMLTLNSYNSAATSLGIKGGATGDQQAMARAVVNSLNAHGGIAGRKVVMVLHDVNIARYESDPSTEEQAACAAFTQDNHVFAVLSIVAFFDRTLYDCLAAQHVLTITTGEESTEGFLQHFPETFYQPADVNFTRALRNNVEALWGSHWLRKDSVVGVIGVETADSREAITRGLAPALAQHGLQLKQQYYVAPGMDGYSGYQSAVLKFASAGVNRVFFSEGASLLLMGQAAQAASYHPYYAVDSRQDPGGEIESTVPAQQLHGSMGIGWIPFEDLDTAGWSKLKTPGQTACTAALRGSGQDLSQGATAVAAMWTCDDWFFLRDVVDQATSFTLTGLRAAAESLGSRFAPASTFATSFAAGRLHDGASQYRLNAFDDSCTCYRYVSGARPLT
jgi:hypothetical protein